MKSKAMSQGPFGRLGCPDGLISSQVRGEAWYYRETAQWQLGSTVSWRGLKEIAISR
jgi:hypothetical protein